MSSIKFICPNCKKINRLPKKDSYKKANCGGCGKSLLDADAIDANDNNLNYILQNSSVPVIVDFWAPWCGPCKMMAPNFASAAKALSPKVQFVKVDTQVATNSASMYAIRSIPTLIVFKDGKELERLSGALSSEQIIAFVSKYI